MNCPRPTTNRDLRLPIAAAIALVASAGCSSHSDLIEVVGVVRLNGAAPPGPGSVFFAPLDDATGSGARPAVADFDLDGKFSVRAYGNSYGMKPGRYRVTVQIWKERPQGYLKPGVNAVPPGYKIADLVVKQGDSKVELIYDVETKAS